MRIIKDYKPEASSLWERLKKAGFTIRGVSNDGETMIKAEGRTEQDLIEELLGADEGWLYVTSPAGKKATLYLVYGNEPGVIVCDYSDSAAVEAVVDEHCAEWESREQPTLQVNGSC